MSFNSAIPVNRSAYGQTADFDQGPRERNARAWGDAGAAPRQSVNISEETLLKVARAKLGRMVSLRLSYDQQGALKGDSPVGSLLSVKA